MTSFNEVNEARFAYEDEYNKLVSTVGKIYSRVAGIEEYNAARGRVTDALDSWDKACREFIAAQAN